MFDEINRKRCDHSVGKRYASDLTDEEWKRIEHLFDSYQTVSVDLREMVNACFYVDWTGCQWRALPKDFGPWSTANGWKMKFQRTGLWRKISLELLSEARVALGRKAETTAGLIDSQSVKASPQAGPRGTDGGKKVRGIKRHIVTCTAGLLVAVLCTAANVHDSKAAQTLLSRALSLPFSVLIADSAYVGPGVAEAAEAHGMSVRITVKDPTIKGFAPLPIRWRVEATFGALTNFHRRLVRNWETSLESAENAVWTANARRVLRAVTRKA